jgi:dTDP-4-dehydrorhamnose reductase
MKLLVLGGSGMLGHRMFQVARERYETYVSFREDDPRWLSHPAFSGIADNHALSAVNALQFESVTRALDVAKPDVVINCIGFVKQRHDPNPETTAIQLNALFPHQLADICQVNGIRLIHFSTDCVFSGARGRYTEGDLPDPVDLYGRTKLLGELDRPGCITMRTSIVGWELKHNTSLLQWFRSRRGHAIQGYKHAIYTGLSVGVLSELILNIIGTWTTMSGIYHVASKPISKYDLLVRMRDILGWRDLPIEPNESFRCDRSLIAARFEAETGWKAPEWDLMLNALAAEQPVYEQWRNHKFTGR